jgi:hypothetical protein
MSMNTLMVGKTGDNGSGNTVPVRVNSAGAVKIGNATSGGTLFADTSAHTGTFGLIQVIADAKFNILTGNLTSVANTTSGSAPTIPAGTILEGSFTAITLHSGTIIAYNA